MGIRFLASLATLAGASLGADISLTPLTPEENTGQFTLLPAERTGLDLTYRFPKDAPFALMTDPYSGNGVCIGDVDGDALPDIFLTHYDHGNRLYRNLGDFRFEDITEQAGVSGKGAWSAGASFVDIENDGDLDLFVCVFDGPNQLYENDGKGMFKESAASRGLDYRGPSVMMAFADHDLDGDLDGYLVTHRMPLGEVAKPPLHSGEAFDRGIVLAEAGPDGKRRAVVAPAYRDLFALMDKGEGRIELITAGRQDVLYQNDGKGNFVDVSERAGITGHDIGLAATWWDANGDGRPDLYVSNDYKGPDRFYLNQGDGTFQDVVRDALPHIPWLSMGSDFSDINGDGLMDFMATDMAASTHYLQKVSMGDMEDDAWFLTGSDPRQTMRNAIYLNTGTSRFTEAAFLTGLAATDWTWSPKFGDLDNDGREDLFVTNGMSRDFMNSDLATKMPSRWRSDEWAATPVLRQRNLAFRNLGDLRFEKTGQAWGLDELKASYGAAYGDLDGDGDLDLVVTHFDDPVSVLRNDINVSNRMTLALRGTYYGGFGIGAEVTVETEAGEQVKQLALARGFMSANEPLFHFGLGGARNVRKLTVRWHGIVTESLEDLPANQHVVIRREAAMAPSPSEEDATTPRTVTSTYKPVRFPAMPASHRERAFDDYARQPLLPMKHSQLGPGLAVGDVDGDGRDDFYMGGAAGQAGQLVLISSQMRILTEPFQTHAGQEDMGALFFDVDGDGDEDLYVVSGGVECEPGDDLLRDRLYLNDGEGGFTDGSDRLPATRFSGSTVAAADFDRDGDLDLFVGTRLIPGRYPESGPSQLLVNQGETFIDEGGTLETGLVTAALWADLNDDGWPDLVVAEDWGPLKIWWNREGKLETAGATTGLGQWTGWWSGVACRDLDGDGDLDLAASNLGLNTKYKASPSHPLYLYFGDVDGSGEHHLVEAGYEDDVLYPKRGKSCSTRAMPSLRERFPTYHQFASATLDEIYGDTLERAGRSSATTLESGAFLNNGRGSFAFRPFPREAQLSQGFGIAITEVNGDAHPDVYFVQNQFHPQPETGRFDSGLSQLLLGKGDGTFAAASPGQSGLVVPGDAKALVEMDWNRDGGPDWLVSQNDGSLLAFQHAGAGAGRLARVHLEGPRVAGARLELTLADGSKQTAEVSLGGGYLSQSSLAVTFGLPGSDPPSALKPALRVRWPDGRETTVTPDPESNQWIVPQP